MRVFASLLALSLLAAPAEAAPRRVASLNLCTDELLLLLGHPAQVASVTHLSHSPLETLHWRTARRYRANDGSLLSVARLKPDLLLTMGGGARDRGTIARRLGVPVVNLPYPQSIADLRRSIVVVGTALGRREQASAVIRRIEALERTAPAQQADAIWLAGGGRTINPTGLAAEWMRLAGLRQRTIRGDRITLEQLLVSPPAVLLRSDYRQGQYSGEQRWLAHPLARRARAGRTLRADGRRWTCVGPSLIPEIERLRRELRNVP